MFLLAIKNYALFQTHFARRHKDQEDLHVKPHHRVGQGPLQVIVAEQPHEGDPSEDSLEDEVGYESNDDDHMPEDEEEQQQLAKESYTALK